MCDDDNMTSSIEVQRAIVKYRFKTKNEAKSYLFKFLIGNLLEGYLTLISHGEAFHTNDESIWYDL